MCAPNRDRIGYINCQHISMSVQEGHFFQLHHRYCRFIGHKTQKSSEMYSGLSANSPFSCSIDAIETISRQVSKIVQGLLRFLSSLVSVSHRCVRCMVLSPNPEWSRVRSPGACLLVVVLFWRALEDNVLLCDCLSVCIWGGFGRMGPGWTPGSLIYCGGFMWLWLSHTLAPFPCFHLQSFGLGWGREKDANHKRIWEGDGERRGISILTSSQGQKDMW